MNRSSISISSLLNKDSIDPIPQHPTINEAELWNHTRTGLRQTTNGQCVVSSLAKAKRKRILEHQYKRLMEIFQNTDTPSSEVRHQLAKELNMTNREVQVWFQNRRAKSKSKLQQSKSHSNDNQRFIHHSYQTRMSQRKPIQ